MMQFRTVARPAATAQVGTSHDAVAGKGRMASVAPLRDRFAQIPNKGARNHRRQRGANDNAALGPVHLDGLKINPADDADKFVADLNRDALHKVAGYGLRLAQSRFAFAVYHTVILGFALAGLALALMLLVSGGM